MKKKILAVAMAMFLVGTMPSSMTFANNAMMFKSLNSQGDLIGKYKAQTQKVEKKVELQVDTVTEFPRKSIELVNSMNKNFVREKFKFESSNSKVVTVDDLGLLRTRAKGNAVIKISTYHGSRSKQVKVHVKNASMAVAFTFDDGPAGDNTQLVLDTLKQYDFHATFFMVGQNVGSNAQYVKRMLEEGHQIGTHTWDHINMGTNSRETVEKNVQQSIDAIEEACGQKPSVIRPPYGSKNEMVSELCKELDLPIIMWNVDTEDWKSENKTNEKIKSIILEMTKPGRVVLLHDLHATSANGFAAAVPELKKRGFELVTVSELAELHGEKLEAGEAFFGYY